MDRAEELKGHRWSKNKWKDIGVDVRWDMLRLFWMTGCLGWALCIKVMAMVLWSTEGDDSHKNLTDQNVWISIECQVVRTLKNTKSYYMHTATKISFLFWELRGLSPNFHIHVSVSDLYIPRIGPHTIFPRRIGRPMVGKYKSLTDTWMWKLGLVPRNSFSGIFVSSFRYCFFAVHRNEGFKNVCCRYLPAGAWPGSGGQTSQGQAHPDATVQVQYFQGEPSL